MVWPWCKFRMQLWNMLHVARWKYRMQKSPFWHLCTTLSGYIFGTKACIDNRKLLNSNTSSTCPDNMVNFGLLMAEICWQVWGTPANFNGFRVFAALLHGTLVVGVSQTLWRWTEGATYIWQAAITLGIGPHSSLMLGVASHGRAWSFGNWFDGWWNHIDWSSVFKWTMWLSVCIAVSQSLILSIGLLSHTSGHLILSFLA